MQRAIEVAREEMKKGILELPAETEASAATMRRAVSEQIKALAELNEIVARQGRSLDVSAAPGRVREPAPKPVQDRAVERAPVERAPVERPAVDRAPVDRTPVERSVERAPVERPVAERAPERPPFAERTVVERAPMPMRARPEAPAVPPAPPAAPARRPVPQFMRRAEVAPEPRQPEVRQPAPPRPAREADGNRDSWLSELLARASSET
ncbi:MAG: hypothetical protein B7Z30_03175, partial [Rhizobiales bacterium 12-68-15]